MGSLPITTNSYTFSTVQSRLPSPTPYAASPTACWWTTPSFITAVNLFRPKIHDRCTTIRRTLLRGREDASHASTKTLRDGIRVVPKLLELDFKDNLHSFTALLCITSIQAVELVEPSNAKHDCRDLFMTLIAVPSILKRLPKGRPRLFRKQRSESECPANDMDAIKVAKACRNSSFGKV